MFSLKLKQYDEIFHDYDQVKWHGSGKKAGGGWMWVGNIYKIFLTQFFTYRKFSFSIFFVINFLISK